MWLKMDVNINFDMSKARRRRIGVQPSLSKHLLKAITVTLFQCLHHKAFQCNPKPWPVSTAVHGFIECREKVIHGWKHSTEQASFIIYTRENYLAVLPLTFLLLSVQGKSKIPVKFKIRCNFIYFAPDASIIS